jgi:hypothetical protein
MPAFKRITTTRAIDTRRLQILIESGITDIEELENKTGAGRMTIFRVKNRLKMERGWSGDKEVADHSYFKRAINNAFWDSCGNIHRGRVNRLLLQLLLGEVLGCHDGLSEDTSSPSIGSNAYPKPSPC